MTGVANQIDLYHFTRFEVLASIANNGLDTGSVFVTPFHYVNGVWLTTSPTPHGHGLHMLPTKQRYRFHVRLDRDDPRLKHYVTWAKTAKLDPRWVQRMNGAAREGGKHQAPTWHIYFGVMPTSAVLSLVDMTTGKPIDLTDFMSEPQRRGTLSPDCQKVDLFDVMTGKVDLQFSLYEPLFGFMAG